MARVLLSALTVTLLVGGMLPSDVAGQVAGCEFDPPGQVIIDNGTIQLGINPEGHLNVPCGTESRSGTPAVGLRYVPTNAESTAPGCLCEGWGVANHDEATGTFAGYANVAIDGVVDLVVQPGTQVTAPVPAGHTPAESVGSAFRSIVKTSNDGTIDGRLRITHSYHPSPSPNLYQVDVTIENIGMTDVGDLRYRRVMDWDVEPTPFNEWVQIHVGDAANLLRATNNGFETANPLQDPSDLGSGVLGPGSEDYYAGPADQGALFDFAFGRLPAGQTQSFRIYYGAAANKAEALAAIASVGAEVYSLGLSTVGGVANEEENTFIFAFSGVGGAVVNSTPVADAKTVTTPDDTPVPITLSGGDAETAPANFTWTVGTPAHGTLTGTPPNLTYTPDANYSGPDQFTYTVTDRGNPDNCGTPGPDCAGPLSSEPALVSITVTIGNACEGALGPCIGGLGEIRDRLYDDPPGSPGLPSPGVTVRFDWANITSIELTKTAQAIPIPPIGKSSCGVDASNKVTKVDFRAVPSGTLLTAKQVKQLKESFKKFKKLKLAQRQALLAAASGSGSFEELKVFSFNKTTLDFAVAHGCAGVQLVYSYSLIGKNSAGDPSQTLTGEGILDWLPE